MLPLPGLPARPLAQVVLAGGSGTRLWPLSRTRTPKHLLPLGPGGRSLLREAALRTAPAADLLLVVTTADQVEAVVAELAEDDLPERVMLAEPVARGTGPALAWAAHEAIQRLGGDAVVLSAHADHLIPEVELARRVQIAAAQWAALADGLLAIGVAPSHPATGFGYIEVGPTLPAPGPGAAPALDAHRGLRFVEKPTAEAALRLTASGTWQWNTGLFAWPAGRFVSELERVAPEVSARLAAARASRADPAAFAAAYADLPRVAVEPLVLERTDRLLTLTAPMRWNDLGSYADLHAAGRSADEGDALGNVARGDAMVVDGRGCYVDARAGRLVVALGCDDLVIVDAGDAVLVCPRDRAQGVGSVVERLRAGGREALL